MSRPFTSRLQRGVSLVEAMVSLAVMGLGMLGYLGTQGAMRQGADLARQRSEATRIAQERMDNLRRFTVVQPVAGQADYAAVQSQAAEQLQAQSNTVYSVQQAVLESADPAMKTLTVTVTWDDRAGHAQQAELSSVISATPTALSGLLAANRSATGLRRPLGRHPTIPYVAKELGNGSSAFRVAPAVVWQFNNATGAIVGRCVIAPELATDALSATNLGECTPLTGQLVSGYVRFLSRLGEPLAAAEAENPPGPVLGLDLAISLDSEASGDATPPWECYDNAPATALSAATRRVVGYHCLVRSNSAGYWSGRSSLVPLAFTDLSDGPWAIDASASGAYKVCRYTPAGSDSAEVPNAAHPRTYEAVVGNLVNQNFLVIAAPQACPTDVPAAPETGDLVNTNTLLHQPLAG